MPKEIQETKRDSRPDDRSLSSYVVADLYAEFSLVKSQSQNRNPVTSDVLNDVELFDSTARTAD